MDAGEGLASEDDFEEGPFEELRAMKLVKSKFISNECCSCIVPGGVCIILFPQK